MVNGGPGSKSTRRVIAGVGVIAGLGVTGGRVAVGGGVSVGMSVGVAVAVAVGPVVGVRVVEQVADHLQELDCDRVRIVRAGGQPAVIAHFDVDPAKPTVCLYAHMDVQPTGDLAHWSSNPFTAERRGDRLFGRHPFAPITRPESSSPATGSLASHRLEQQALLAEAFGAS